MSPRALCLSLSLTLSLGCATLGGGRLPFDVHTTPSTPQELSAVADRVRAAREPVTPAVAVLVPPRPAQGFSVYSLPAGERLGQVGAQLLGRPVVAGDLVLARVAGAVVAWAFDGTERWRVPDRGYALVGAAKDNGRVAITLGGAGMSRRQGVLVVVDAATGAVQHLRAEPHALGVPALVGDDVFVPWDGQHLSVFDARSGDEVARVHGRSELIGFARREGPSVWYGARAFARLGPDSSDARSARERRVTFAKDGLPGAPPFLHDPYTALNAGLDARERVRLLWRPDAVTDVGGFAGATVYSLFHRDVFGIDPATGAVRWGHVNASDVAGAEVSREGVALVDEQGGAAFLEAATGRVRWRAALGVPVAQAVIQLPADFGPRGATDEPASAPIASLLECAGGTDTRLMPAQLFAVRALIDHEGPEATHALVQVVTHRRFPQELRAAAAEAITHRTNGTEAMIEALEARYDYVREVESPPVGLLARGLAAHRERRAVPLLVAHLHDPATRTADLPALVSALREIADPSAVPALLDFVRTYHADTGAVPPVGGGDPVDERSVSEQEPLEAALEQAAVAIATMGSQNERRSLAEVAVHPRSPTVLQDAIARALRGDQATTTASNAQGETPTMTFQAPPRRHTMEVISTAFFPERAAMLECLRGMTSRPATVRIMFRYDGAGSITNVIVNPATLQPCIEPIAERVRLPESHANREPGVYNLTTHP